MARYDIYSGIISNGLTLSSGTSMYISSGGVANSTTVSRGSMYISSGGTANNTTVNSMGYMYISSGGVANHTTVNSLGHMFISSGGVANSTTVNSVGFMEIYSGGVANSTTVNDWGKIYIYSGGTANNTTLKDYGYMHISSGGTAYSTTVYGGMHISSGGVANSTTVNSGGGMYISSGGTATDIVAESRAVLTITVASDTYIQGTYAGSAFEMKNAYISGYTINACCSMFISSGGVANNTTVTGASYYYGSMYISSGGMANSTTVNDWGRMDIWSGGVANSTTVNSGGSMYIWSGGTATNVIWTPCVGFVSAVDGAYVTYASTYSGVYFGSNNQLLSHTQSMSGKVVSDCPMYVMSGGTANSTTVTGNYDYEGSMYIWSGGTANSTTVNDWGRMYISSGGVANSTTVNSIGYMYISGGMVNSATVNSGGCMWIFSGGVANNTTVNSSGSMYISPGGVANSTTVNSNGIIYIYSGGVANSTTVNSMGRMYIYYGGVHRGSLQIESEATVSAFSGAKIDFTVADRNTEDGFLINDLSLIQGAPTYTITVSADQADGTYKLAQGASNVTDTLTIGDGTVNYGSITVNGADFVYNNVSYSLDQLDGNLTLTITDTTPKDQVKIYSGTTLIKQDTVLTGEIIYSGNSMLISSGGTANSTTVNSSGWMYIYSGGGASSTTINSSGYMHISSGGTANSTTISSGGYMHISSGGVANSTTLSNGTIRMYSGATVTNVAVSAGGNIYVHGGTLTSATIYGAWTNSHGTVNIYSGGTAFDTVIRSYGSVIVHSGGTVSRSKVIGDLILSGGYADNITLTSGFLRISTGIATNLSGVGGHVFNSGYISALTLKSNTVLNVSCGGSAVAGTLFDSSQIWVYSSGCAQNIILNNDAEMRLHGGSASDVAASASAKLLFFSGNADNVTLKDSAYIEIHNANISGLTLESGAQLGGFSFDSDKYIKYVKNGSALIGNNAVISRCNLNISSGGVVSGVTINTNSAAMHISRNGIAINTIVSGGMTYISGGLARSTTQLFGTMTMLNGAKASDTILGTADNQYYRATMQVSSGAVATNTTIRGNAIVYIFSGGVHRGELNISPQAELFAYTGSIIDFTISGRNTSDDFLINDLEMISGAPTYTITVDNSLEFGTYKLAQWAFDLSGELIIGDGTVDYGSITVNGDDLSYNGITYSLDQTDGDLTLEIKDITPPELTITGNATTPTNQDVVLKISANENCTILYNIDNGEWLTYSGGITVTANGTVNIKATDAVGNVTEKSVTVDMIDKVAPDKPAVKADITGETTGAVTVSAIFSNDSVITEFSLDNKTWQPYTDGVVMESNGFVYFRSFDAAGNVSQVAVYEVNNIIAAPDVIDGDLDGNGLADTILVHTKQGYSGAWLTTGDKSIIKWGSLSDVKAGTEILGTGTLYGSENDGQDIFFADSKSVGAWNVVDGKVTGYKSIMSVNSTTNVLGLGDFNGDGATDILLRSTNGDLGYYNTDGTGFTYLKGLGKEWTVAAIGDLNGDGLDDVVLRHDAGFAGTFLTQENGTVKWASLDTLKSDMTIVGTGDFNGDGVDDVLLQNKSNGWVGAWLVEEGRVDSFIGLCTNKNTIEQIADFNGDGIDDLRIRAGADIGVLYVNGADDTTWQYFKSVGTEWDTSFSALA